MRFEPLCRVGFLSLAPLASAVDQEEVITRDVCILGGGGNGTYAAIHLIGRGYTVALVEHKDRLGGHSETLYLPDGQYINYGVRGYFNTSIVTDFFNQLNASYEPYRPASVAFDYVNFRTGARASPTGDVLSLTEAVRLYRAAVQQFDYLSTGAYDLPDEFVQMYSLQGALHQIFSWTEPVGNILDAPLLYVLQDFGLSHFDGLLHGLGILPTNGTDELFRMAARQINEENILYRSIVTEATRVSSGVELVVESTKGVRRVVRAKRLLITFPPTPSNLRGFDLREEEYSLFSKWMHMSYYTAVVTNTSIPDGLNPYNVNPTNEPGNLPLPPFEWILDYPGIPGYHQTRIVGDAGFTEEDVKNMLLADIKRIGDAGTFPVEQEPTIVAFANHSPETLMAPVDDIREGFYRELYALQGRYNTYYTGYTFCTDYSPLL
ncbi:uncharacterized protein BJX67DRAFT_390494 [Aspergillus lucknowensis]|uniref:Amine oxidase domain-containing protein n=1 Tax=Aspergillus lucknowensis TaxID=176173 RepID=A0ABR4M1T1_9EURO